MAQKRHLQPDLSRETEILYTFISDLQDSKDLYCIIDEFHDYFSSYFFDLNEFFRDFKSGELITKSLIIAHALYYRMSDYTKHKELYFGLQKYIFRAQLMMLSGSHKFHSLVYKQQVALAKNKEHDEGHPLRTIGRFLMQTFWISSDGHLGEDTWPR